jgi:hypothetical protein
MASTRHRDSTATDAMAVLLDSRSSDQRISIDNNAEEADFSPSLHKKEMLEREYNDDDEAFSDNGSDGQPDLPSFFW